MAALFPIPFEVGSGDPLPGGDRSRTRPHRPGRRTVVSFDPARAARRRRAIRRRTAGLLVAAVAVFVAIVFTLGVAFAVIDALSQPPAVSPAPSAAPNAVTAPAAAGAGAGTVVVVQSGDTLTSIARELQPTGDITALVDRLAAQHGPAPLLPGERLLVSSH